VLRDTLLPAGDDFLSPEELSGLSPQLVIERTNKLEQLLFDYAPTAEETRLPSPELWNELRRSGYFYMLIPRTYGGLEASLNDLIDASLPIARGCASTAWLAMFGVTHNRHLANWNVPFQDEVFGGGKYVIQASATMPPGAAVECEGGYRVSGRWAWATLATVSDWVQVIVVKQTPDGPAGGMAMLPIGDVAIIDTWDTDGMRATGTHDIEAHDVFVPESHTDWGAKRDAHGLGARLYENPLYRLPLSPLLAFTTLVPTVGAAQSAVALYRDRLLEHTKRGTKMKQAETQASQIRLATADTMVNTAEVLMRHAINENLKYADLEGRASLPIRNKLRAEMSYAAKLCRDAVVYICESNGTSIHYLSNPLQRILRDVMVMTSHVIFDQDVVFEQHGRTMLGLPITSQIV
jgi:alkylation response protein AidB-like acyl-CoA dehydrogenase